MATLQQANLNQQVYDVLRRRILAREVPLGTKLTLNELADELGVSRSPVHHALTRLVSEGLLTVTARRGYYVTPVEARTVAEGYDVRLALELQAAEAIVEPPPAETMAELGELLDAIGASITSEDWSAANGAFHQLQVDCAGNELLSRLYRELAVNSMMPAIRGRGYWAGTGAKIDDEHEAIVAALESGDGEALQAAVRRHVATGKRIALAVLEGEGGAI